MNDIMDYISLLNCEFDAIGFTETWFSDNISSLIKIDGYNVVESHRQNKKGGGVGSLIYSGLLHV